MPGVLGACNARVRPHILLHRLPLGHVGNGLRLGTVAHNPQKKRDYRYRPPLTKTRIFFVGVAFALMLTGSAAIPALLDPYSAYARVIQQFVGVPLGDSALFSLSATGIAAATVLIVAAASWKARQDNLQQHLPRRHALGVAARHAVLRIDINTELCINCGECQRVCKSECISLTDHTVDNIALRGMLRLHRRVSQRGDKLPRRRHRPRTPLPQPGK